MRRRMSVLALLACVVAIGSLGALAQGQSYGFGFGGSMAMGFFPDMSLVNVFMSENGLPAMDDVLIGAGGWGRGGVLPGVSFGGVGWGLVADSGNDVLWAELVSAGGGFDLGFVIGGNERSVLTLGAVFGGGANVLTLYETWDVVPMGIVPEPLEREIGLVTGFVQPYLSMAAQFFSWMGFEFRVGYILPVFGFEFGDLLGIPAPPLELSGPTVSFGISFGGIGSSGRARRVEPEYEDEPDAVSVTSDGSFAVGAGSTVVVENVLGDIRIIGVPSDPTQTAPTVVWHAVRTAKPKLIEEISITVDTAGVDITLEAEGPGQVDYEVLVPIGTNLSVRSGAGDVTFDGYAAETVIVEVGAGEIYAADVDATSFVAVVGAGEIKLVAVDARALVAEVGLGEISIGLPADASATLEARTSVGDLSVERFPGMVGGVRGFIGHAADVILGEGTNSVKLAVGIGRIDVGIAIP